jgi:hypothetical protein
MIDNIELIKPILNFEKEGDFYMLYVFKRKKDQPEGEKDNHQSVRTIKTYTIESIEYLDKRYEEIKQLCEVFNARAYIHIQKQNHFDVSLEMMIELAQRIRNGVHKQQGLFDSVVGQIKTQEKRWIVDVDTKDETKIKNIIKILNRVHPQDGGEKIETIIPTKNGCHLITKKFNVMEFQLVVSVLGIVPDIQKKNPTLLYLPNSLT